MPKKRKTPPTPAQIAAAAIARATRQVPEGFTAVQAMLWIPSEMLDLWQSQKPAARGAAWVVGVTIGEVERTRSANEKIIRSES